MCVCVCVSVCVSVCVRACVCARRIVSKDKTLRFKNTLIKKQRKTHIQNRYIMHTKIAELRLNSNNMTVSVSVKLWEWMHFVYATLGDGFSLHRFKPIVAIRKGA